jgi:hypothetical protein
LLVLLRNARRRSKLFFKELNLCIDLFGYNKVTMARFSKENYPRYESRNNLPIVADVETAWGEAQILLRAVVYNHSSPSVIDELKARTAPAVWQRLTQSLERGNYSPLRYLSRELRRRSLSEEQEDHQASINFPTIKDASFRREDVIFNRTWNDYEGSRPAYDLLSALDHADILAWTYHRSPPSKYALALSKGIGEKTLNKFLAFENEYGFTSPDLQKYLSEKRNQIKRPLTIPTDEEVRQNGWERKIRKAQQDDWQRDSLEFAYEPSNEPSLNQGKILLYTEVPPERAAKILNGQYGIVSPSFDFGRWFAELTLERFQPMAFRGTLSRKQPIYSSPLPYLGRASQLHEHSVLLGIEVDQAAIYIADMAEVNGLISGPCGYFGRREIEKVARIPEEDFTQVELEEHLNAVGSTIIESAFQKAKDGAGEYWRKVVPYTKYLPRQHHYREPEVLLTNDAIIHRVHYLEERKVKGNYFRNYI